MSFEKSPTITELAAALSQAQLKLRAVPKNAVNPYFKSKYADLASVIESSREVLAEFGLAITQFSSPIDPPCICLVTTLMHKSGEWISGKMILRAKSDSPQDMGSCITYARRYSLSAMLNIASEEDDDGNAASKPQSTPARQSSVSYPAQGQNPEGKAKSAPVVVARGAGDDYVVKFGKYKGQRLSEIAPNPLRDYKNYLENQGNLKGPGREFVDAANKYLNSIEDDGLAPITNDDLPPITDDDTQF